MQTLDLNLIRTRISAPLASTPRPFLRWAGSKRLVLQHLAPHLPERFGTYFEPFLGGGSLFFALRPSRAVLADTCAELINTYAAVAANPAAVLRHLSPMRPDRGTYYAVRAHRSAGRFKKAAEFIYLNKTCWNGLYRVNSRGVFNVPFGKPKTDHLIDTTNFRESAVLLGSQGVELQTADFEAAVSSATSGDFVFFDPPYVTGHRNNGFVDYNEKLFSWSDQERLAEVARSLARKGCQVLMTNADHPAIIDLYPDFEQFRFDRKSTIASDPAKRTRTTELVLVGRS